MIYNKPSVINVAIEKIKNFLSYKLLVTSLLLKVSGVPNNTSCCKYLLPADSSSSQTDSSSSQNKLFYHALSWHLKHEGVTANHPLDPGGFTYKGISQNAHPNWEVWKYLTSNRPIPESIVVSFYDSLVWRPMMCDSVPPAIAFYLFDTACLIGTPYTIYLLQKNLNIKPDGIIGPQTLQAIRNHNPKNLLSKLHDSRIEFHNKTVQKNPNLNVFYKGWVRRACLAYQQATILLGTNRTS